MSVDERLNTLSEEAIEAQRYDDMISELGDISEELKKTESENPTTEKEKRKQANKINNLEKRIKLLQTFLQEADETEERNIERIQNLNTKIKEIGNETYLLRTQIRESKAVERDLENTKTSLQKQIAELEEKNKLLQEELNISRDALRKEESESTGDSTTDESISRENDLANTIRKRIKENKERKQTLERDMERKKEEKEILEERIAKLEEESRDRFRLEERRRIAEENIRVKNIPRVQQHTYESLTENPVQINLLEEIKKIELNIKLQQSLADELAEFDYN